ncbi:MAG: addiction module toxin RelE [bacterium]
MPKAWSKKDEKQFDHVKQSELDRGLPPAEAAEIAGRTVNKQRREEGRTPNKRTQGTGNPNLALGELKRDELYNRAKERHVKGRARMSKAELIQALR